MSADLTNTSYEKKKEQQNSSPAWERKMCVSLLGLLLPLIEGNKIKAWNNSRINPMIFRKLHIVLDSIYKDCLVIGLFFNCGVELVKLHSDWQRASHFSFRYFNLWFF